MENKSIFSPLCLFILVLFTFCTGVLDNKLAAAEQKPVNIIFDTDMGSDCDDAAALAMLHKYADEGMANILAVIYSSGKVRSGSGICDAINTYYRRGDIPIGQYTGNDVGDTKSPFGVIGTDTVTFPHEITDSSEDMISVYKQVLKASDDHSVTIVLVGHPHALWYLLHDPEGLALVKAKVKKCICMAGVSSTKSDTWNWTKNGVAPYMPDILEQWPTDLYVSAAGSDVLTGNKLLPNTPVNNPVREAYRLFANSLVNGRPSWDPIALMYAVEPYLFNVDSIGSFKQCISTNEIYWYKEANKPNHKVVTPKMSDSELEGYIEKMISANPKTTR